MRTYKQLKCKYLFKKEGKHYLLGKTRFFPRRKSEVNFKEILTSKTFIPYKNRERAFETPLLSVKIVFYF